MFNSETPSYLYFISNTCNTHTYLLLPAIAGPPAACHILSLGISRLELPALRLSHLRRVLLCRKPTRLLDVQPPLVHVLLVVRQEMVHQLLVLQHVADE